MEPTTLAIAGAAVLLVGLVVVVVGSRRRVVLPVAVPSPIPAEPSARRRLAKGSEAPPFTGVPVSIPTSPSGRMRRRSGIRPTHARR